MNDEQTAKYQVALHGCDDSTYMTMELTDAELAAVQRVADLSTKTSTYQCMPVMTVAPSKETDMGEPA